MSEAAAAPAGAPATSAPAPVASAPTAETTTETKAPETTAAGIAPEAAAPAEAAPAEPEAPKPEKPSTKDFVELRKAKVELHRTKQEHKAALAQIEKVKAEAAPIYQAAQKFKDAPIDAFGEFAKRAGFETPQQAFEHLVMAAAKNGDPPDPNDRVSKLEARLREKEEAERKAAEERQQAAQAEAEKQFRADLNQRIDAYLKTDPDRFELCVNLQGGEKTYNDLIDLVTTWHNEFGESLTVDQAAEKLEAQYLQQEEERLTKASKLKKLSRFFAPPAAPQPAPPTNAAPATQPAAAGDTTKPAAPEPPSPPKTIPNGRAAVPAGSRFAARRGTSSDRELVDRLAAMVKFK